MISDDLMETYLRLDAILQPLKITPGWCVGYNIFTELDPSPDTAEYFYGSVLFSAMNRRKKSEIELYFEPEGDPNGKYILNLFLHKMDPSKKDFDYNSGKLIQTIASQSRAEIIEAMERFMSIGE